MHDGEAGFACCSGCLLWYMHAMAVHTVAMFAK